MTELWGIAQECWSPNPRDRPLFPLVLAKINTFASLEEIAPFELRKPKPMQVVGESSYSLFVIAMPGSTFIRAGR